MSKAREAGRRLRLFVDAWLREYGEAGPLLDVAGVPDLDIEDLVAVLEEWEGEPQWALISKAGVSEDGFIIHTVHKRFLWEQDARAAARLFPGSQVGWWDEDGNNPGWRT